jgi:probable HAF family extracellular repeat protein
MSFAENSFFAPGATETHATLWWGGAKFDMGTLGGPDSAAADINLLGQAVGWSYTSYEANAFGVPDVHPFLWNPLTRKMRDLGSLGGSCAAAGAINNLGQVVGHSTLANDTTEHPFLWTAKGGMRDLGSLGGDFAHANAINDRGEVIGYSTMVPRGQGQSPTYAKGRAFYWYNGVMKNLGTFGDDYSDADGINNLGQIVGETFSATTGEAVTGWISDRGGPIVDLNTLVDPAAGYHIIAAGYITDTGTIGVRAIAPDGTEHPLELVPTH